MIATLRRLYRGETSFDFIGRRKIWYSISAVLLALSIGSLVVRGFELGIDFAGGAVFQFPAANTSVPEVEEAVRSAGVTGQVEVQKISTRGGGPEEYRVQTLELPPATVTRVSDALSREFGVKPEDISPETVGAKWGATVTRKALQGLLVFLVLVIVYISMRFEPKMALTSIIALFHDILFTAGIYSLVGFEVTPSTVIAFLTILGYSLYDNVVVFDKLRENTVGLAAANRMSYTDAANLSVNQTIMRSVNTTLTSLLPVGSLLFVGALFLGAGTLKDLSLSLFVGMAAGAYSSIFVATPLLCEMKEREPQFRALAQRVRTRQVAAAKVATAVAHAATVEPGAIAAAVEGAPGPGAVRPAGGPARTPRPAKKGGGRGGRGGRPGGKKRR